MQSRFKWTLALTLTTSLTLSPQGRLLATPAGSQQPQPPVFGVQTSAVVVDVVVRDKKGRLVRDLTAADFELSEDNVKQKLESFRLVDTPIPAAAATAPTTATPPAATPATGNQPAAATAPREPPRPGAPSVIAFVFDRLSANGRKQAHKAALGYTDQGHVPGDLVGVFSVDLALRTLQPFTTELPDIKAGLERAASQGNTAYASDRADARERLGAVMHSDDTLSGLGSGGQAAANSSTQTQAAMIAVQQAVDQTEFNMLRAFDTLERDQQGFATTNGLLAVVGGLRAIPGRKTVVFFSEGISIPSNVLAQFRSVIATANRANVSVYAIDVGGLRIESGTEEARKEIVQAAQRRMKQEATGRDASDGALTKQLERNEDVLRFNPESGLGQLAEETGGFLVHDTNDASRGFARIEEDMRFHYMLAYTSSNEGYDGSFRTISVKVRRPGVEVQARKGYFAVRPDSFLPVRAHEAPALAQLDRTPQPNAFPLSATALSFPEAGRLGLAPVLVEIPGKAISWGPQRVGGFHAEFVVVVRIKDENGRETDRLSQQYSLAATMEKFEAARAGNILFYKEANLGPGRYIAEVAVWDALAHAASVRSVNLSVPKADQNAFRLSSLVVVSRADKLTPAEQQDAKNPLYFGEVILYPNLGTPIQKSKAPALGFYFSAYGKTIAEARTATIEVLRDGKVIAKTSSALPPPGKGNRIQHAGALPTAGFAPGAYTLRVSVSDGTSVETRDAPFTVVE